MGLFGSIGGMFESEDSESSGTSTTDKWTEQQKAVAQQLYDEYFAGIEEYGATPYEGQLTADANQLQNQLYQDALTGEGVFSYYSQYTDPEKFDQMVADRLAARDEYYAPIWEQEDAILKEQMANMGLTYSSDTIKAQMDQQAQREAATDMYMYELQDAYAQLGLEATEQSIAAMQEISGTMYDIEQAGLTAAYQEWLRQQPEYSPIIEQMMAYLGLSGTETTDWESESSSTSWGVSGEGGYKPA